MIKNKSIAQKISSSIMDIPGWSPDDQLLALYTLAISLSDLKGDILEIGSWCGRSSAVLGFAAKLSQKDRVYCVDLFPKKEDWYENDDGTFSIKIQIDGETIYGCKEQTLWRKPFYEEILPIYDSNPGGPLDIFKKVMLENNLDGVVFPERGDLKSFLKKKNNTFKVKLAFIDGDHSYEAVVDDIRRVEPFLSDGAWVCFDDAFTVYNGVDNAINDYILDNGKYELFHQITRKMFIARYKGIRT
jgi:predicted O-methyltransferase YrrM